MQDRPVSKELEGLLAEQVAYYRAVAGEYEDHSLPPLGADELTAALEAFRADSVTAVDASPEMLAIAAERNPGDRVRFVHADLFDWEPDARHDVVFFGFWLSHVPLERFEAFWSLVDRCPERDGRVFFADDGLVTREEVIDGSHTIRRRLNDGTAHRIQKVPHQPAELEARLARLGWGISVRQTAGPFYWGEGARAAV
jgi:SAM-dependent methyltransferase